MHNNHSIKVLIKEPLHICIGGPNIGRGLQLGGPKAIAIIIIVFSIMDVTAYSCSLSHVFIQVAIIGTKGLFMHINKIM